MEQCYKTLRRDTADGAANYIRWFRHCASFEPFPLALDANFPMMPIRKGVHFNGILITYQIN